jgi:peptidoglycan/LPS O-acetylase OafA/YrhL
MAEERLGGADFVRAAACLMVLVHHLVLRLDPFVLPPLLAHIYSALVEGLFGVGVFFVLSGFLLARPFWTALDAGEPMPSLRVYFLRRAARILPGFWLALTVTFVLSITVLGLEPTRLLAGRYLAGLLLVSDWSWPAIFPVEFNGPLWSIGFEVTSYVLLPLAFGLLWAGRSLRPFSSRLIWVAVIAAAVSASLLFARYLPGNLSLGLGTEPSDSARSWVPRFNPFAFFAIFAIGALGAGVQVSLGRRRSALFDLAVLVGSALALGSIFVTLLAHGAVNGYGLAGIPYGFPWFPLGIAIVLAAAPSSALIGRLMNARPTAFIARVSFGIYVWHFLIIELTAALIVPQMGLQSMHSVRLWLVTSLGVAVASVLIATVSFYFLEQPVIRWARAREPAARERGRGGIPPMLGAESEPTN